MCINLIVQYLRNLGIKAGKKYEKKRKILASEVSQKAVQKTNVDDIVAKIESAEQQVSDSPTKAVVQQLLDLYQKAIEYYSAVNDNDTYTNYLNKMTAMFQDENIQKALNAPDDPPPEQDKPDE